jgi:hypothetical protein
LEEAAALGSGVGRGLMELGLLVMNTLRMEREVICSAGTGRGKLQRTLADRS